MLGLKEVSKPQRENKLYNGDEANKDTAVIIQYV